MVGLRLEILDDDDEILQIPEVPALGSAPVQEQVIVLEIPEVLAGPPVSSASASVQEQEIVCETPGVQVLGDVQEQVIVRGFPDVNASTHVQEKVIVQEIPEVQALACVQEPVNVFEIPEVQADSGIERVQQRTVEQNGTPHRVARGTSSAELKPGESSGDGFFSHFSPPEKKCECWAAVQLIHGCS